MKKAARRDVVEQWWGELERLGRILGKVGPDEVCCEGLSQRQTAILRILVSSEGARLSDLAAMSGITPSAMTRVLEKLEARGLVERVRGAQTDGRAAMVRITDEGRKTRQQIDGLMRQRADQILNAIPEKQRSTVFTALQILNSAIESSDCCPLNMPVSSLVRIEEKK
jgi:DNA-binding MarR family transcriptional regulator